MQFLKDTSHLKMTRGRTFSIDVTVTDDEGDPFVWAEGSVVRFGLKRNPDDTTALLTVEVEPDTDGYVLITILPEQTEELSPGTYWYDIGYQEGDDYEDIVPLSMFDVLPCATTRRE